MGGGHARSRRTSSPSETLRRSLLIMGVWLILLDSGAARHDCPATPQQAAACRTMPRMAEDHPGNRRGCRHPRNCALRGSSRTPAHPRRGQLATSRLRWIPAVFLTCLTLTSDAIIKAAEFWALLRQTGVPTAAPDALDADAILVGQAALAGQPGDTVTIATTNLARLNRFPGIDAQTWDQIR